MKSTFVLPYNSYSKSASELSNALGIKRIALKNSRFVPAANKTVINWGNGTSIPQVEGCKIVNDFKHVKVCANKKMFFDLMSKSNDPPRVPEYTTDGKEVTKWLAKGETVCARQKLSGSGGEGLVIFSSKTMNEFVKAPLYTKYIKKKEEYRVHFAFGRMIAVQQKILRKEDDLGRKVDPDTVNWQVRNLANGFIFARNNLHTPDDVITQAEKAYKASKLDFGAVDVIYNEQARKAYVLEINCAPGLVGETIDDYRKAFKENL